MFMCAKKDTRTSVLIALVILIGLMYYFYMYNGTDEYVGQIEWTDSLSDMNPDLYWISSRKIMQRDNNVKRVILFCYMRGGSTFFSEFFLKNPDVAYFYEPLDSFYNAFYGLKHWMIPLDLFYEKDPSYEAKTALLREYPDWEYAQLSEFHHDLVHCNLKQVPVELFVNKYHHQPVHFVNISCFSNPQSRIRFAGVKKCGKNMITAQKYNCAEELAFASLNREAEGNSSKEENSVNGFDNEFDKYVRCRKQISLYLQRHSLPEAEKKCKASGIVVYKALRYSMKAVHRVIHDNPDTHVLYMVRDPRAIIASTENLMSSWGEKDIVKEAKLLCVKMTQDFQYYELINSKFPGAIKLLRYEDLASSPSSLAKHIYNNFLNIPLPSEVAEWLEKSKRSPAKMNETVLKESKHNTYRANWTSSIEKWRQKISVKKAKIINKHCREVLQYFHYSTN